MGLELMQVHDPVMLDRHRCGMVVVDFQNDFCHPDGRFGRIGYDVSGARAAQPHLSRLIRAAHEAAVPVIYLRTIHGPWTDAPEWARRPRTGESQADRLELCAEGSWGAEFYELAPQQGDLVITKHRYSGFAYTPLELALRAKHRDTVVLGGVLTDVCVEATATDALAAGFTPVLVPEATSAATAELQRAAELAFADHIGAVVGLDALIESWVMM